MTPKAGTEEFSSRIKGINIELHGYSYFHSPSEVGSLDRRFIGREKIIEKLKSILTRSESRSGAYLVTGYRGMGKSSFVAKVISEISAGQDKSKKANRYFRILLFLLPLAFLDQSVLNMISLVLVPLLGAWTIYTDRKRNDLGLSAKRDPNYARLIARSFFIDHEYTVEDRSRSIMQDIYLLAWILMLANGVLTKIETTTIGTVLSVYLTLYALLALVNSLWASYRKVYESGKTGGMLVKEMFSRMLENVKNRTNSVHRVFVTINLGHDELKERDILVLIAKSIKSRYHRALKRTFSAWRLSHILILWFFVGCVYYFTPLNEITNNMKREIHLINYLPSQSVFVLAEKDSVSEFLDRILYSDQFRLDSLLDSVHAKLIRADKSLGVTDSHDSLSMVIRWTRYLDLSVALVYAKCVENLPVGLGAFTNESPNQVNTYLFKEAILSSKFQFIPRHLDYFFWLTLLLVWIIFRSIGNFQLMGVTTNGYVFKRIKELSDRIDSNVTVESGGQVNQKIISLFGRRQKAYPIADVREIESRLVEILELLEKIPRITMRPSFVFIFDELDKIEPGKTFGAGSDESGSSRPDDEEILYTTEAARKRQHTILRMFSNLKFFLTTANAKFIFIAGREMFDASLADVSDRQTFMGSIFNDVIYVDSFLSDPTGRELSDITRMTEKYVCKFILPREYRRFGLTLSVYNQYLKDNFLPEILSGNVLERESRQKREKIIHMLETFIVYLTYRSNGSPKKITRFFEHYVVKMPKKSLDSESDSLTIGKSSRNLYLSFGFYDQYIFAQVTYLVNPFLLYVNRSIRNFGDKILVSTSFLVDHLYKFHSTGFSWRTLELTPEIVDINKSPELRNLIGQILRFLTNTHIQEIMSGLYRFKFNKRIVDEISFLAKVSERESAAFNFTLDESLSIKRHYRKVLKDLSNQEKRGNQESYTHSIGFVQMIIGDLHFYDQEYDNAIVAYLEASQNLKKATPEKIYNLVILVRNELKLGLTFEKKRTYESALMTYATLVNLLEEKIGGIRGKRETEESNLTRTAFEGVKFLVHPILAKLYVIEKQGFNGITASDIGIAIKGGLLIGNIINHKEKYLIEADFWHRIGDILYYKNGPKTKSRYCERPESGYSTNNDAKDIVKKGYQLPCRGCRFYALALRSMLVGFCNLRIKPGISFIGSIFDALEDKTFLSGNTIAMREMASVLSNVGDTFMACTSSKEVTQDFLDLFLRVSESVKYIEAKELLLDYEKDLRSLEKVKEAMIYYYLAAVFYEKAGLHKEYAFQFTKLLHVVRRIDFKVSGDIIDRIGKTIVKKAIRGIYRTYESTHRLEIEKLQAIFESPSSPAFMNRLVYLGNISASSDIKEIVLIFDEIRVKCGSPVSETLYYQVSPYTMTNSIYNRIIELRHKADLNYRIIKSLGCDDLSSEMGKEGLQSKLLGLDEKIETILGRKIDASNAIEFLITDSIFCYHEIVKFCRTAGFSYLVSHSLVATVHQRMSYWTKLYFAYRRNVDTETQLRIVQTLTALISEADLDLIAPKYHAEIALHHFHSAKEVHSEGEAYRNFLENMFYLDDGFSDNLYHFCAAIERYEINSESINKKIREIKKELDDSSVYDYKKYLYPPTLDK